MFGRNRQYSCMNNQYNNSCDLNNDIIEESCNSVANSVYSQCNHEYMDCCECGFDEEYSVFPEYPMLAQSYVHSIYG